MPRRIASAIVIRGGSACRKHTRRVMWNLRSMKKGRPKGGPQSPGADCSLSARSRCVSGPGHDRAGRIGDGANDIKCGASAVGLLQGPVAHVQLQSQQHTVISHLVNKEPLIIARLRALVFGV